MTFFRSIMSRFRYGLDYTSHPEAAIITCYFNPQRSPYRLKAFKLFYDTIKHLNHEIIECAVGDSPFELDGISTMKIRTPSLLWHKESLLNLAVHNLPADIKYVFWVDADVLFMNRNWFYEGAEKLKSGESVLQPFEFCHHLDKDKLKPYYNAQAAEKEWSSRRGLRIPTMWKSFSATYAQGDPAVWGSNYDRHGHVGFAWGARRDLLENVGLYDKCLVGGADHIIAHASIGDIFSDCTTKGFAADLEPIHEWSHRWFAEAQGRLSYVKGHIYHIWHGDLNKRGYLPRILEFTPKLGADTTLVRNPVTGLYESSSAEVGEFTKNYFASREVAPERESTPEEQTALDHWGKAIDAATQAAVEDIHGSV